MEIVHVISLQRREDRIVSIVKESKRQGFPLQFFEGIDEPERKGTAKAICMAHKNVVRYAAQNNLTSIIVAEDDLFFYGNDNKAFQYFLDNTPDDYDLYMGCIYNGEVNEENRVLNGMSGSHTLLKIHSRFYDFILNEVPDNCNQDRYLGQFAWKFKYYVCLLIVCGQIAGYTDNLKQKHNGYEPYLENRKVYGRDAIQ